MFAFLSVDVSDLHDAPVISTGKEHLVEHATLYRTIQVDGLSIFYRQAGPKDAPTLLLLDGLRPSMKKTESANGIRDFPCEGKNPLRKSPRKKGAWQ
jgi:hypothetical protein